jgi:hypothetical protein
MEEIPKKLGVHLADFYLENHTAAYRYFGFYCGFDPGDPEDRRPRAGRGILVAYMRKTVWRWKFLLHCDIIND